MSEAGRHYTILSRHIYGNKVWVYHMYIYTYVFSMYVVVGTRALSAGMSESARVLRLYTKHGPRTASQPMVLTFSLHRQRA